MIKSMTGYGRAEAATMGKKLTVEMKSVNHRYLEVALRLPGMFASLEAEIKKRIGEHCSRGRIEITVRLENDGEAEGSDRFTLNVSLLKNYHALLRQIRAELGIADEITLPVLAGFRDIFVPAEPPQDPAALWTDLASLLDEAVCSLTEMREREGQTLYQDFTKRLTLISEILEGIAERTPQVIRDYQQRLSERVRELMGGSPIDESRLIQEVAIMADRSDITEEIVRFRSHIAQFSELLKSGESAGRKIDFLLQEMGREINTIGSKSSDIEISRRVIEVKSELGKLREQVQNIE